MKILLTGASSYVGARLYFDLSAKYQIIGTYNENKLSDSFIKLDTTNPHEVNKIVTKTNPTVIIHAAANANPRWCEANPEKAIAINQKSTEYIVSAANKIDAKVILISSITAKTASNVYSKTKLASEEIVKQAKNGYVILRPSLIIGYSPNTINDRPFNRLLINIYNQTEPIYDTSWKFQPTYIHHISEIIENVLDQNITNEIIPIAVKELKSRYDIAKDILKPFGIEAIPEDKHDATDIITDNLETLLKLGLPQYSYKSIIEKIINEIHQRRKYNIK